MADVREKRGFRAVKLSQGLGSAALLIVGPSVTYTVCDLRRHQLQESSVTCFEAFVRAQGRN